MKSVEEVLKINNSYEEETARLNKMRKQVYDINDELDLEEVKDTLDYKNTKNLFDIIKYKNNKKEMVEELKKIMQEKKIKEYPQILEVHYYLIIKDMDFLSKKDMIELDKLLMNSYKNNLLKIKLNNLSDKILEFLINNKILEKQYIFHCTCGSDECFDKIITDKQFQELKDYWQRDSIGGTTHEEDERMGYGCFETGCWNDGNVEISCLKEFNEHLKTIRYKVIEKPDMTLDNI